MKSKCNQEQPKTRKGEEHGVGRRRHFIRALMRIVVFRVFRGLSLRRGRPGQTAENGVCSVALLFPGKRNEFRSTQRAMFGPRLHNRRARVACCVWSRKNGRFLPGESARPSRIGPARCGPRISMLCRKVMYPFSSMKEDGRNQCAQLQSPFFPATFGWKIGLFRSWVRTSQNARWSPAFRRNCRGNSA